MSAQHTPWHVEDTNYGESMGRNLPVAVVNAKGERVALCGFPGSPKPQDVENALAIVAAINATGSAS